MSHIYGKSVRADAKTSFLIAIRNLHYVLKTSIQNELAIVGTLCATIEVKLLAIKDKFLFARLEQFCS